MTTPYIAVDFDGTLAQYSNTGNVLDTGLPIPLMLQRVLIWLHEGKDVRIVTARVNSEGNPHSDKQRVVIDKWCKKYIGRTLPVTCRKSHAMLELWDDRAIQVIPNTGDRVLELDGSFLAGNVEDLHCSSHFSYSTGCRECYTAALFSSYVRDEKLEKIAPKVSIHSLEIKPSQPSPKIQLITNQLQRKLYIFFQNAASDAATALRKNYLKKAEDKDRKLFLLAWAAINWSELTNQIYSDLYEIAKISASDGVAQLEVQEDVESLAKDYATTRISEMIGGGTRYSIADTTKDDLEVLVDKAVNDNKNELEIANEVKVSPIFSRSRSELIAETETTMSMVFNHLEVWKRSGKVKLVNIELSDTHIVVDMCDDVVGKNPWHIDKVPSIPLHPECRCSISVVELM